MSKNSSPDILERLNQGQSCLHARTDDDAIRGLEKLCTEAADEITALRAALGRMGDGYDMLATFTKWSDEPVPKSLREFATKLRDEARAAIANATKCTLAYSQDQIDKAAGVRVSVPTVTKGASSHE
jgi:hypothetical protein